MAVTFKDLENLIADIGDDVARMRRLTNAAHALAVAVKNEVGTSDATLLPADEQWRVNLTKLADDVLTEISPARS